MSVVNYSDLADRFNSLSSSKPFPHPLTTLTSFTTSASPDMPFFVKSTNVPIAAFLSSIAVSNRDSWCFALEIAVSNPPNSCHDFRSSARYHRTCKVCYNSSKRSNIINCKNCNQDKPHAGYGYCDNCYKKYGRPKIICKNCQQEKPHSAQGYCESMLNQL